MDGVTIHMPISIDLVGAPTGEVLEQLAAAVEKAILERIAESRRQLPTHAGPDKPISVAVAGEAGEEIVQGRLDIAHSTYALRSYGDGGSLTQVGVQSAAAQQAAAMRQQLEDMANSMLDLAESDGVDPGDAAYWTRVAALLLLEPETIATLADVHAYVDWSEKVAHSEEDTLRWLRASIEPLGVENELSAFPAGFPKEWSRRVYAVLDAHIDLAELRRIAADHDRTLTDAARRLPDVIYANGLPYSMGTARMIRMVELDVTFLHRPSHPVGHFARQALDVSLSFFGISYLAAWQRVAIQIRDDIAAGTHVADPDSYRAFKAKGPDVLRELTERIRTGGLNDAAMRELENRSNDLMNLELVRAWASFFTGIAGIFGKWEQSKRLFASEVDLVDDRISAAQPRVRVSIAFLWAYRCGYLTEEAVRVLGDIWDEAPEIIASTVIGVIALWGITQLIPGVDVAVDVLVAITAGASAIDAGLRLYDAIEAARNASDTASMERAASRLAFSLVGDGLEVLKDLLILAGSRSSLSRRVKQMEGRGASASDALKRAWDEEKAPPARRAPAVHEAPPPAHEAPPPAHEAPPPAHEAPPPPATPTPAPHPTAPEFHAPRGLQVDRRVAGTGGIARIDVAVNRSNETVVAIYGEVLDQIDRQGFENAIPPARDIDALSGLDYDNAHLWGRQFGDEAAAGVMHAPSGFNQARQRVLEAQIKGMRSGLKPGQEIVLRARGTSYPRNQFGGALAKSYEYDVAVVDASGKTLDRVGVVFEIEPPTAGGTVHTRTVRGGLPPWH